MSKSSHEPPTVPHLRPAARQATAQRPPVQGVPAQRTAARRTTAQRPTEQLPEPATESPAPGRAPDLTVNKVIAGAGAAATSAVLGSFFGAAGTVTGAALGSVASTVATVVYQRSLDRTRDKIVARIKVTPGRRTDVAETQVVETRVAQAQVSLPAQRRPPEVETVRMQVEPAMEHRPKRRPWLLAGATVLVFAIGLLAVTGLEWAKGSSLTTGQTGTSVGRVLSGGGGAAEPTRTASPNENGQSTEPSSPTEQSTQPAAPTQSRAPGIGATETPAPSRLPGLGNDRDNQQAPETGSPGTRSGAPQTPLVPVPGAGDGAGGSGGSSGSGSSGGANGPSGSGGQ